MKRLIFVSIAMMTLAVSTLAQEKSGQRKTTKVSKEFSQAANKALVAIGNSSNDQALALDSVVQEAINSADAAAFSKPEKQVVTMLVMLSAMRPLQISILKHTAPESEQHEKARADLYKTGGCIEAMRKALHDLSGNKPEECKDELP